MKEPSAQYLTFMQGVFRGCNVFEASFMFISYLVLASIIAAIAKIIFGHFFIVFLPLAILTQVFLFKYTCSKYGDYKSNKPPGVARLKILEYGKYIGLKPKHVTRAGTWSVGRS